MNINFDRVKAQYLAFVESVANDDDWRLGQSFVSMNNSQFAADYKDHKLSLFFGGVDYKGGLDQLRTFLQGIEIINKSTPAYRIDLQVWEYTTCILPNFVDCALQCDFTQFPLEKNVEAYEYWKSNGNTLEGIAAWCMER